MKDIVEQINEFRRKTTRRFRFRNLINYYFFKEKRVKKLYFNRMGVQLNLERPKSYNEKLQWLKLNYYNDLWIKCANKATVRDYLKDKGLERFACPTLGIYRKVREINFEHFQKPVVIKIANASGFNLFVSSVNSENITQIKKCLRAMQKEKYYRYYFEWVYKSYPYIIIEPYLESYGTEFDHKFHCINGEIVLLQVLNSTLDNITNATFDKEFNRLSCTYGWEDTKADISKPPFFEEMVKVVKILAKDFLEVRIDCIAHGEKFYINELTFFPGSGYDIFDPNTIDEQMGEMLQLEG